MSEPLGNGGNRLSFLKNYFLFYILIYIFIDALSTTQKVLAWLSTGTKILVTLGDKSSDDSQWVPRHSTLAHGHFHSLSFIINILE